MLNDKFNYGPDFEVGDFVRIRPSQQLFWKTHLGNEPFLIDGKFEPIEYEVTQVLSLQLYVKSLWNTFFTRKTKRNCNHI